MGLKDLKSRSDQALANIAQTSTTELRSSRPTTAPGATAFMQPTIDALNERAKTAEARAEEYRIKLEQQPVELPLDVLIEVPNRKRKLTPEQLEELKGNLSNNQLVHPITVRRAQHEGRFEIVSGHNRVDVFRGLGRTTIPVVVLDMAEETVDRSAFYANLLQPSLPDYEKFRGFKQERERTGLTQKQMAKDAGVAESVLSMLFSFDQLPQEVCQLIERRPDAIGMNCAAELAKLARNGREARVVEAVAQLVDGRLTQKEAVRYAARQEQPTRTKQPAVGPVKIRVGRLEFCQYHARGTSLRIEFRSEEQRLEAEAVIAETLQLLAERAKTGTSAGSSNYEHLEKSST